MKNKSVFEKNTLITSQQSLRTGTSYLNNLIDNGFVNVGECDFLSEEFHVHRGQGLAGRMGPPFGKLSATEKVGNILVLETH